MNPAYTARKFYEKLVRCGVGSADRDRGGAAVQISAYPDAYAKHEDFLPHDCGCPGRCAARTVESTARRSATPPSGGEIAASGWTAPIPGDVGSGFQTTERPSHNGVGHGAAKGTDIRAAAAVGCWSLAATPTTVGGRAATWKDIPARRLRVVVDMLHAGGYIPGTATW